MTALGHIKCFKCDFKAKVFTSNMFKRPLLESKDMGINVPEQIVFNPNQFHPDAIMWLARAHIYNQDIIKQGIGYLHLEHKVFLPTYDNCGNLKFYQTRSLSNGPDSKYKYLTYGKTSDYLIHYHDHSTINYDFPQTNPTHLLICEDHLSAIRLRKIMNVVALSGTTLARKHVPTLLKSYRRFIFWLDPDAPGISATHKNIKFLKEEAKKTAVRCILSAGYDVQYSFMYVNYATIKEDPKKYSDYDIKRILSEEVTLCPY
jgi:hypothetical protein